MGFFDWFDTRAASQCGISLAELVIRELPAKESVKEKKFAEKAEKTLIKMSHELAAFKRANKLNTYKKAKLGNAFLWTLKDRGVNDAYADELTQWLSLQL